MLAAQGMHWQYSAVAPQPTKIDQPKSAASSTASSTPADQLSYPQPFPPYDPVLAPSINHANLNMQRLFEHALAWNDETQNHFSEIFSKEMWRTPNGSPSSPASDADLVASAELLLSTAGIPDDSKTEACIWQVRSKLAKSSKQLMDPRTHEAMVGHLQDMWQALKDFDSSVRLACSQTKTKRDMYGPQNWPSRYVLSIFDQKVSEDDRTLATKYDNLNKKMRDNAKAVFSLIPNIQLPDCPVTRLPTSSRAVRAPDRNPSGNDFSNSLGELSPQLLPPLLPR